MRLRRDVQASLATPHGRFPACSLENSTEVDGNCEDPSERGEEPEPLAPFGGLLDGRISVRRQWLFLGFAHGRGGGGLG